MEIILVLILNVSIFEVNFLELIYTTMHLFTFCYLTEININLYETFVAWLFIDYFIIIKY